MRHLPVVFGAAVLFTACVGNIGGSDEDERQASAAGTGTGTGVTVPTADAGAPRDTGVRPDSAPPRKVCCICEYFPTTGWGGPNCAGQTQANCTGDCRWENNTCVSVFIRYCNDWLRTQTGCDSTCVQAFGGNPNCGQTGCTEFRYHYEGHGQSCSTWTNKIRVCVGAQTATCSTFDFDLGGCSTFSDLPSATAYMQSIQAQMGGSACATVSANQCTAYAGTTCQTRAIYTITQNSTCQTYQPCAPGTECIRRNENALCRTANGISNQRCCCTGPASDAGYGTGCTWRQGVTSCP